MNNKLKSIFIETCEKGDYYEGTIGGIDFFRLRCIAASKNITHTINLAQVCMYKINYNESKGVLILFSLSSKEKNLNDKIIDIIQDIEDTFRNIMLLKIEEIKSEKMTYVYFIIGEIEEGEI